MKTNKWEFYKKKKLLEYVILKELKHNQWFIDERKALETDAAEKVAKIRQISSIRKLSGSNIRLNNLRESGFSVDHPSINKLNNLTGSGSLKMFG